jgi:hypothetical protein
MFVRKGGRHYNPAMRMSEFDATSWTLIRAASAGPTQESRDALAALCQKYWQPIYAFIRSFSFSCSGWIWTFNGSGSDLDGSIRYCLWPFGDGEGAYQPSVTHVFNQPRSFTVTLTVIDDGGAAGMHKQVVDLSNVVNVPPVASFTSSCLLATCTHAPINNTIVVGEWDLGLPRSCITDSKGQCVVEIYGSEGSRGNVHRSQRPE